MKAKQVAASRNQTPEETHLSPGADRKLKSERVQLDLQLPDRLQRKFREATGGRYSVGEVVTVGLDLTEHAKPPRASKPSAGGSKRRGGVIVEAGSAAGTPGQNHQPSTLKKGE